MHFKSVILLLIVAMVTIESESIYGASEAYAGVSMTNLTEHRTRSTPSMQHHDTVPAISQNTLLGSERRDRVIEVLGQDYEYSTNDLVRYRWFFRKTANVFEASGNCLLYIGSGLSSVSAAVNLIGSTNVANILLFSGTACFAAHLTLIGLAKCSARESGEREAMLETLANQVNFHIARLKPTVTDDQDTQSTRMARSTNATNPV